MELLKALGGYFHGVDGVTDKRQHSNPRALRPSRMALEGDNGNYTLNLWRQEVSVSLEATENVTKLC